MANATDDRDSHAQLAAALLERFGGDDADLREGLDLLGRELQRNSRSFEPFVTAATRRSHRRFSDRDVPLPLLEALAAIALAAPSKSDLQQRDIVILQSPEQVSEIKACIAEQAWTADAPRLLIFCGNNRRQRQLHEMRGKPFANDHLDAFFNAAVDAGIALQAFIAAAEHVGLGCCPISAIRNHAAAVSDTLGLPQHVFPVAGLAVGWPARPEQGQISHRLALQTTVHIDRFNDQAVADEIEEYDARRAAAQPYTNQRAIEHFGELSAAEYTWSEDKARQYAEPERADFGAFVVKKGFTLR